ncbi:MAG: hypothetical protein R3B93_04470 [Bacteroidia bacterium]
MKQEGWGLGINIKVILDGKKKSVPKVSGKHLTSIKISIRLITDHYGRPASYQSSDHYFFWLSRVTGFDLTVMALLYPSTTVIMETMLLTRFLAWSFIGFDERRKRRVLIDGFYDGITIDANIQKILDAVPDDAESINAQVELHNLTLWAEIIRNLFNILL